MNKIIPTTLIAAALTAGIGIAPAHADSIFVPGTRQNGQPTQVGPHYADRYGQFDYVLDYPRDLAPLVGSKTLDQSAIIGAKKLVGYGGGVPVVKAGDTITGESQGAVVADLVKRYAAQQGIAGLKFVTYGDPINARGGFLSVVKFGPQLLGMTPHTAAQDTPYDSITYVVRYDGFADSPNNASIIQNPVAWINALAGTAMYHGSAYGADKFDPSNPANIVSTTTNSAGGKNTYVLHTESGYLPIVQLGQRLGLLNAANAYGTNKTLTPIVEAAYNRPKADPKPVADKPTAPAVAAAMPSAPKKNDVAGKHRAEKPKRAHKADKQTDTATVTQKPVKAHQRSSDGAQHGQHNGQRHGQKHAE